MQRALRWAVLLLLLWPVGPAAGQLPFSPTQDPLAGSRVFGAKGCVKCHAVNGVGGKVGPDLGRILHPRSFYDLAAATWNHLPRMAERMRQLGIPRPHLDPREAGDLIAFLFTLNYFDPPGSVEAGRWLFTEKKCVVCHQVAGTGGVVGPSLDFLRQYGSPIFVAAAMWNHGPAMTEAMRARKIERPTFRESELLDLIAYLKSASPAPAEGPLYVLPGRADEGRRLFVENRCIACHSAGGQGGRAGPDLAERGVHRSLTAFAAAMWNKAPAMIEAMKARGITVPQLRAEEMADIVAYLYAVQYFAGPGDPAKGRELAATKGCLTCHTVWGKGGKVAGDLARAKDLESSPAVIAALWNHIILMEQWPERQRISWPRFSPGEMADLVAFLQGLGRAR
ncbi:MAG: c-type cytochrome [candidate division NC10 bacterium]|nr:c-type cytochrome [candidate division NC10 bacterium]MBI4414603.1 c-type cytochrome [candidate division NC10 bacterium]